MLAATTYDIMLHAGVATRFTVRHRWVIAGSFATEAEARAEYAALCREFPGDQVSLILLASGTAPHTGHPFERVLDTRGKAVPPERRRTPAGAGPGARGTPPRPAPERPLRQSANPAAPSPRVPALAWGAMAFLTVLSLAGTLLLAMG